VRKHNPDLDAVVGHAASHVPGCDIDNGKGRCVAKRQAENALLPWRLAAVNDTIPLLASTSGGNDMIIATYQGPVVFGDAEANLSATETALSQAEAQI
jgi:hypothetical protein